MPFMQDSDPPRRGARAGHARMHTRAEELAVGEVALDRAVIPIVLSAIPRPCLSDDELAEFRSLSAMYANP